MDEVILEILSAYGLEVIVIALIINVLTNLLKKPIKAYTRRSGRNLNKYISFIPIVMGFTGASLYYGFTKGWAVLRADEVVSLGVSSASLSLAMFAIIEKFMPEKKQGAETIVPKVSADNENPAESIQQENESGQAMPALPTVENGSVGEVRERISKKIILGRKREGNDETET
ncbi:MAG: hypothetical protein LBK69_02585 [Syntrophomonadaceae bacterium]|jgi:hypothetical protein|nr:hypothetical protein [Syntrophomonadaceae bacterium]